MENWKTILVMLGLVAIGFAAGFYTHRSMAKSHFERVARTGTPVGFQERLLDEVLQVNEAQREKLEPIVKEFGRQIGQLHRGIREERAALVDSLYRTILDDLDEAQQERLKVYTERQKKMRKRPGRPPGKKRKERERKGEHN